MFIRACEPLVSNKGEHCGNKWKRMASGSKRGGDGGGGSLCKKGKKFRRGTRE